MPVEARSIPSIAKEWDRLADELGATPFHRPGWTSAWWRAFGHGTIRALVVRTGERLTGVVALVRNGSIVKSPTNHESPIFGLLAEDPKSVRPLASALLTPRPGRLDLSFVPSEDPVVHALREEALARGFHTIIRPVLLSPYVTTQGPWTAYQATLGVKLKSEIRRRTRRLQELGEFTLDVVSGAERLDDLLSEGFRVEQSGWKGAHGSAINSHPRTQRFYQDIARWANDSGWLTLAFLRLDGRAIAFDLCLEANRIHFLLKTGFDHDYQKFGPGMILRSAMLERAFSGPIDRYEFLGSIVGTNNRWKLDWTDRYHERMRLQAFPPTLTSSIKWLGFRYGPDASQKVRSLAGKMLGAHGREMVKKGRGTIRQLLAP